MAGPSFAGPPQAAQSNSDFAGPVFKGPTSDSQEQAFFKDIFGRLAAKAMRFGDKSISDARQSEAAGNKKLAIEHYEKAAGLYKQAVSFASRADAAISAQANAKLRYANSSLEKARSQLRTLSTITITQTSARRDARHITSLPEQYTKAVAAAVNTYKSAKTVEDAQRELTSVLFYLRTYADGFASNTMTDAQRRTATELAIAATYVGATKMKGFISGLGSFSINANGEIETKSGAHKLDDLLKDPAVCAFASSYGTISRALNLFRASLPAIVEDKPPEFVQAPPERVFTPEEILTAQIGVVAKRLFIKNLDVSKIAEGDRQAVLDALYRIDAMPFHVGAGTPGLRETICDSLSTKLGKDHEAAVKLLLSGSLSGMLEGAVSGQNSATTFYQVLLATDSAGGQSLRQFLLALSEKSDGKFWYESLPNFLQPGFEGPQRFLSLFEEANIIRKTNKGYELVADASVLIGNAHGTSPADFEKNLSKALRKADTDTVIYKDNAGKKHTLASVLCELAALQAAEGSTAASNEQQVQSRQRERDQGKAKEAIAATPATRAPISAQTREIDNLSADLEDANVRLQQKQADLEGIPRELKGSEEAHNLQTEISKLKKEIKRMEQQLHNISNQSAFDNVPNTHP